MKNWFSKTFTLAKEISKYERLIDSKKSSSFKSKMILQLIIAIGFLLLSVANIISKSYIMLILTTCGFIFNALFLLVAWKSKKGWIASVSSSIICAILFAAFVVYGGNDGFASLWIILFPLFSMIIMDFMLGFCISVFFQIFLFVLFWTPLHEKLPYAYNQQFCLRFPLFFLLTFVLGLLITISLRHAEYNEYKYLIKLEEMNEETLRLSRIDPLTKLANRRFSYEEFERKYIDNDVHHQVVMCDVDGFKSINDRYGHDFGDSVLATVSKYMIEILPENYLKSRWGGEEFLFAANASKEEVFQQVENLRKTIAEHRFIFDSSEVHITMTFGIAEYKNKEDIQKAIKLADERLYDGKRKGKNCTIIQ